MRHWIPTVLVSLSVSSTALALAPGDRERGFREGANHHIGDDSFAAMFGRLPGPGDSERLRMHTHFVHVRAWLASREATRPELSARRAEILGHFDAYIAKGTTPRNAHLPWRTPVFIDDENTICAVGYLIEQSAGRPLAEKIAREHRYALLEDIAAAMPEVRAWVESSGLTLEELSSIQPGYIPDPVVLWNPGDLVTSPIAVRPVVLGDAKNDSGTAADSDTWHGAYPSGQRLSEGPLVDGRPQGTWRFFHPSGHLAAEGRFDGGLRTGTWRFFHDAENPVLSAVGKFQYGGPVDGWRHYDAAGKLFARARPASPASWGGAGYLTDITRGDDGASHAHHWVHQGNLAGTAHRLDFFAGGAEQLYVRDMEDAAYDAEGHKLARVGGDWQSSDCHWSHAQKATARAGDVVTLDAMMLRGADSCEAPQPVSSTRAKKIEATLAPLHAADDPVEVVAQRMAACVSPPVVDLWSASPPATVFASR